MEGELVVPKKEQPFDITLAKKVCEIPLNLFKSLGYTLDFDHSGYIRFTCNGTCNNWYVSKYQLDTIYLTDAFTKAEIRFSYRKENKEYKPYLQLVNALDLDDKDKDIIKSALGTVVCNIPLNK